MLGSTEVYSQGTSWEIILKESENIIFWASDPVKNLQVGWNCETHEAYAYLEKLKEKVAAKGVNVICVDPVKSKTQNFLGCEQQYINPQTDVPFMLALAHTLYTENLYDKKFLDMYTVGFEKFLPYLLGETEDKVAKTRNGRLKFVVFPPTKSVNLPECLPANAPNLFSAGQFNANNTANNRTGWERC